MTYDDAGNRLTQANTLNGAPTNYSGTTNYQYDIKDQLTQESSTRLGGYTNAFVYDSAGNPTTYGGMALTFDAENRMTAFGMAMTAGYPTQSLLGRHGIICKTIRKGLAKMDEIELSPEAQREQAGLQAATERMRAERIAWEEKAKALEALVRRKEALVRRQQAFLAEIRAERQAIETEHQRIHDQTIPA